MISIKELNMLEEELTEINSRLEEIYDCIYVVDVEYYKKLLIMLYRSRDMIDATKDAIEELYGRSK